MRRRIASFFAIALLLAAPSQLFTASAWQDNKDSSAKSQPAAAKTDDTKSVKPADDPKPQKTQQQPDGPIKVPVDIVNVMISVTDPYGRFVTGLAKDHFEVFDDKVKQQIAHFT